MLTAINCVPGHSLESHARSASSWTQTRLWIVMMPAAMKVELRLLHAPAFPGRQMRTLF